MSFPNLSALAVREKAVTLFFLILAIVAGVYAFLSLGRAEDPNFTVRAVIVNVSWPGATPQEMRDQVVKRLEQRIQEISGLDKIETTIQPGQAYLQVQFYDFIPEKEIPSLRYEVRKRMQQEEKTMPVGVIGPNVFDEFSDVYFHLMAVTAPGLPMRDLTRVAESIRERVQRVPGVLKAVLIGERPDRVYVDFDAVRLINLGFSAQEAFDAINSSNSLIAGGRLETAGPRVTLRFNTDLADPEKLADVSFRIKEKVIKLSDIATIRRGYEDPPAYIVRSKGKDSVIVAVEMEAGENGLDLGKRLNAFWAQERALLPIGIELELLTNQMEAISAAVDLFQLKFLIAVVVVVAVSMVAIGWKAGLVVGIAVPVTLGITFLVMKLLGIDLDRITLGALIVALGLLVDDAIISVEMMLVKMEEGWDRIRAASHAWSVTAAPMLFGTLVTVAGFLPIGFAKSAVAEYAGNIFWVLAIALIVSWFVAVIFAPYLGVIMLPRIDQDREHSQQSLYNTPVYKRLRKVIRWCVQRKKIVVFSTFGLLVMAGVGMATAVGQQFFPRSDRPEALVSIFLPKGTSALITDETVKRVEKLLLSMDGVRTLSTYTGGGAPRFFLPANPEAPDPSFGKILVVANDAASRDSIMDRLNQHIADGAIPEARLRVYRLDFGPPVFWPLAFRVVGQDPLVLRKIGHEVRNVMGQNPNIVVPHLEWDERIPILYWNMDTARLRLLGLSPQDVQNQLQFQLDGLSISQVRQDIRSVDVVGRVVLNGKKLNANSIGSLEILSRDGKKIPISQIGLMEVRWEDPIVRRFNGETILLVQGDVKGAQAKDITYKIWKELEEIRAKLPEGYRIDIAGTEEESSRADASIQKLQPLMLCVMLIFIMLQMRTFSGTAIVLATAPLGLIGAVLALILFNQPFGFVSLLGLIGLAGILMRNTLILTQQVADNFDAGMSAYEGVVEAAVQRARPVVLTALAAVFAFVPLTQDPFWGPMAYVLIGGVAVGTVITLLYVPALYALWFKISANNA